MKTARTSVAEAFAEGGFAVAALISRVWLLHLPDLALAIPRAPTAVRAAFFYVFAQALGLLWAFILVVLQALSHDLVQWLVAEVDEEQGGLWAAIKLVGRCYVLLSTLRMLVLAGGCLWTLAWEAASDFPTVRRLLLEKWQSKSDQTLIRVVLAVPIAVITLCFAAATVVPAMCSGAGANRWLTDKVNGLVHIDGRGNRMLRFSLVVMMLQWGQLFEALCPTGLLGLCRSAPLGRKLALFLLLPASFARLTQFAWRPTDHVFFGSVRGALPALHLSRHTSDNLLAVLWGCWLTAAVLWAPASPGGLGLGGRVDSMSRVKSAPDLLTKRDQVHDEHDRDKDMSDLPGGLWEAVSVRFQYTLLLSAVLYWGRSCLSPHIGWTFAQNDLMALLSLYPALSVVVWSATYAAVSLLYARPRWVVWTSVTSALVAVARYPGMQTLLAALHALRQVHKTFGLRPTRREPDLPMVPAERRWARGLAMCSAWILACWFVFLSGLS